MLWVAHWDGSSVRRWDPNTGKLLPEPLLFQPRGQRRVHLAGEIWIAATLHRRFGIDADALAKQPHAGALFRTNPGVRGVPAFEFAG